MERCFLIIKKIIPFQLTDRIKIADNADVTNFPIYFGEYTIKIFLLIVD